MLAIALLTTAVYCQPSFHIDYAQPANIRFDQVYRHFREPILKMEHYFYSQMTEENKAVFDG